MLGYFLQLTATAIEILTGYEGFREDFIHDAHQFHVDGRQCSMVRNDDCKILQTRQHEGDLEPAVCFSYRSAALGRLACHTAYHRCCENGESATMEEL